MFPGIFGFQDNTYLSSNIRITFTMKKIQEGNMKYLDHNKIDRTYQCVR